MQNVCLLVEKEKRRERNEKESCRNLDLADSRGMVRPRMTWRARLGGEMKDMGLRPEMAMGREKWRCSIMGRTCDPHKRLNNGR